MSQIDDLLQDKSYRSVRITLTEEVINDLLSRNKENRKLNKQRLYNLENDLKTNGWKEYASMAVGDDGNLADGQHRLTALKRAGIYNAVTTLYLNVDRETLLRIDEVNPRSTNDTLHFIGVELPYIAVGVINLDARLNQDNFASKRTRIEPYEVEKLWREKWKDIFDNMPRLASAGFYFGGKQYRLSAGGLCAIGEYGIKTTFENANDFLLGVIQGCDENNNPKKVYREHIVASFGKIKGSGAQQSLYRKTVNCCMAHYAKRSITRVYEVTKWDL